MKILQIHDSAYTPTRGSFGTNPDSGIAGLVLDLTFDDGTTRDVSGSRQAISVNGNTQFGDGLRGEHSFAFDGSTIIQVADDPSLRVEMASLSLRGSRST